MNIVVMQNRLASLFRILNWLKLNFTGDGEPKRLCGLCGINNIALQKETTTPLCNNFLGRKFPKAKIDRIYTIASRKSLGSTHTSGLI
jgi:hypothetical protein